MKSNSNEGKAKEPPPNKTKGKPKLSQLKFQILFKVRSVLVTTWKYLNR